MTDQMTARPVDAGTLPMMPTVGDGSGLASDTRFEFEELQLALRNHGMPLEALRYPTTPTGMHYIVVHFDVPYLEATDYTLTIDGLVRKPLTLSFTDITSRPAVRMPVTMECAGNGRALLDPRPLSQPWLVDGIGSSFWTGTPLRGMLEEAGLEDAAADIIFTGVDQGIQGNELQHYQRSLSVEEAMRDEVLIAWAMNDAPLEPQHGYPLRLLVPGWYGMTSVKWLSRIEVVPTPFTGYQMSGAYRDSQSADDPGEPVTLMQPRSVMIPPGIPDFATRLRVVKAGPVTLSGRTWSGRAGITRVEVSVDSETTWSDARLDEPVGEFAWRGWSSRWDATPGRYTLAVRATDTEGKVQPLEQPWTFQGMANNMVQRVNVVVV
jgi:DMSO/TMAO reductase YedYZ molybdopterin-dependent catalytic subunit